MSYPVSYLFENWEEIKQYIREEYGLTDISFNIWIKNMKLQSVKDHVAVIQIPSDQSHALSYITGKFKDYFQIAISEKMGELYDVRFILEKNKETVQTKAAEEKVPSGIQYENSNLNPKYRFDTFVVGSNNKLAYSASMVVAESPGEYYNPLFLYAGAGLGKTHLMHSIGHYLLEQNPDCKVLYITTEQFTNEVIESIRSGNASSMSRFRDKYRKVDVLLIDDIQFIIGKEATQEEFFYTFNELYVSGKQIVLSSDRPPKEMVTLDERFRSRFECGLLADIQKPDYETRMAILRRNADEMNFNVSDEILDYIASNVKSNIRELEGSLKKVYADSITHIIDLEVDGLEAVKFSLKDIIHPEENGKLTPQLISKAVCDHYNVKFTNVASRKKNSELVIPRQVIMYICREYTDSTYENIAMLLGKKDHSTVIHGVEKVKEELQKNEEMKNNVDSILKKLNVT